MAHLMPSGGGIHSITSQWKSTTGKPQPKVTTAIARELVGYAWDIARRVSPAIAG
ncbi:hypothetical protein ACFSUK_33155 [Sphingobium scionense]